MDPANFLLVDIGKPVLVDDRGVNITDVLSPARITDFRLGKSDSRVLELIWTSVGDTVNMGRGNQY